VDRRGVDGRNDHRERTCSRRGRATRVKFPGDFRVKLRPGCNKHRPASRAGSHTCESEPPDQARMCMHRAAGQPRKRAKGPRARRAAASRALGMG